MLELVILILLALVALAGGLLAVFAGRRFYAFWLGFAAFFFSSRIIDMALVRTPEAIRSLGGLVIGILIVVAVVLLRDKVIHYVPPVGGFIVSALVAERLLGILFPEAGKFLFFAILIAGGIAGFFVFRKILDFDNAIIVLSAVWGASFLSNELFNLVDIFLISFIGKLGGMTGNFLNGTQLLNTLLWLGLAAVGILIQRRQSLKPIPGLEKALKAEPVKESRPTNRRNWVIGGLVGGLLVVFLLAILAGSNSSLAKTMRRSFTNIEHSLGLEAEAPGDAPWEWTSTLFRPQLELQPNDRILILAPHPDDDILSNAGLIQQALDKGIPVKVVLFTVGDYNETSFALYRKEITLDSTEALRLGETRREEALAAQGVLGVKPEQVTFLGFPDGGGLAIFTKHWGNSQPYRALLNNQTQVPYTFAQSFNAPFKGESIVADIEKVIRDFQPTKIITSHPGDVHPDQQTLPLYLKVALWDLAGEIKPEVYHFITHYGRWPQPRGYQPEHPLDPPAQFDINNRWHILPLTAEQREKKLQALQAHKTQWGSGKPYLESVVRANELWDVIDEIPLSPGEEVQILPAQAAFNGEALQLLPESEQNKFTESEVRVPLALLGNPQRIMLSSQTSIGDVPLDNIPWVFLNLNPK
jgi:LmbE family N-acetylglucosaminyl deacetylase